MSLLVPTFGEKFGSLIQRCIFWVEQYMMFLCYAQPAHFGDGIPGGSLFGDIPFQCVGNPLVFKISDVGTQGSAISE